MAELDVTGKLSPHERTQLIEQLQRLATDLGLTPGFHPSLRDLR